MFFIYRLIIYISLPVALINLYWRSLKTPEYRKRLGERFGWLNSSPKPGGVWIHCVSVGETKAAIPLIKEVQRVLPQVAVTITCTTPTGSQEIRQVFGDSVFHCYCPFDLPSVAKRFIDLIKPKVAIMVETEIWGHLLSECHQRNVKTLLINGRMSQSSANGYAKVASLAKIIFGNFDYVAAQYPSDAERFLGLGVKKENIDVTGSVKFDISPDERVIESGQAFKNWVGQRPVFIAASTHAGEDEVAISAFEKIVAKIPDAFLIIVPRHPERFDSVGQLLEQSRLQYIRRSENLNVVGKNIDSTCSVLLGDTMGELLSLYFASDVAFVGGSFEKIGGHNILEAAVFGKPTIIGPHFFNFQDVSQAMIDANACFCVENSDELSERVILLLEHRDDYTRASTRAIEVIQQNRGSLQRLTKGVLPIIEKACL